MRPASPLFLDVAAAQPLCVVLCNHGNTFAPQRLLFPACCQKVARLIGRGGGGRYVVCHSLAQPSSEAACISVWPAVQAARWGLVGNAVSVPVAKWLGERLAEPHRFKYYLGAKDRRMAPEHGAGAARVMTPSLRDWEDVNSFWWSCVPQPA